MADERTGRADVHIHSLASDGISSVEEILAAAQQRQLNVIAIADHERVDAAQAAQQLALARGLALEVIVGEEVTTRGGHLVGLFLKERIRPWGSLKATIAQVHAQGGLAIIAHPLVPYPLCASARSIRKLFSEADDIYHPDAIEAFNPTTARMPWARRVPGFVAELGVTGVASSDAHRAADVGQALTTFAGQSAADLRRAIETGQTGWQGSPHTWRKQLAIFAAQQHKNARAVRDTARHRLLRSGTGRDLGYPVRGRR